MDTTNSSQLINGIKIFTDRFKNQESDKQSEKRKEYATNDHETIEFSNRARITLNEAYAAVWEDKINEKCESASGKWIENKDIVKGLSMLYHRLIKKFYANISHNK